MAGCDSPENRDSDNIAKAGEDIMKDQTVLRPGHFIRPQDIAVLAAVGVTGVTVSYPAEGGGDQYWQRTC